MQAEVVSVCSGVQSALFRTSEMIFFIKILKSITFDRHFRYKKAKILVYTGDSDATPKQIISKCRNNFNIHFDPERIEFVFLTQRKWIEAEKYPVLTMLGQSLGSIVLGFEALLKFQPDIYIDTMGTV